MSQPSPTLHLICGKIASGKSTLAARLGSLKSTVVITEDSWLAALYAGEMLSISDYVRNAARLENAIGPHISALLNTGVSVVLDFQANTLARRAWMRGLISDTNAGVKLHYLKVSNEECLARLHARNSKGDHEFKVTDEQFLQVSKHFVAPMPDEGFEIEMHQFAEAR